MKRLFKRILSLILAFCFMLMPVSVLAEEGAVIKSASVSGYAGNRVFVSITAENLENLAALDLDIYYDKIGMTHFGSMPNIWDICLGNE